MPVRLVRGGWPAAVERRLSRLVEVDPRVVLDPDVTDEAFSAAMACMQVGSTIKITGRNRHAAPDALLLEHVDLVGASIVDLGASDGSTSLDLLAQLPNFGSYVIADLYLHLSAVEVAGHVVFFDAAERCVLVAGRRILVWPTGAVGGLVGPLVRVARRRRDRWRQVLLLCPSARARIAADPRVSSAVHDVFTVWPGRAPDVIKVANVLRRLYFSDEDILRALQALLASLPEGGHLLVVDNPRRKGVGSRGGLYRGVGDRFEPVATTPDAPEIDDLVARVRASAEPVRSS